MNKIISLFTTRSITYAQCKILSQLFNVWSNNKLIQLFAGNVTMSNQMVVCSGSPLNDSTNLNLVSTSKVAVDVVSTVEQYLQNQHWFTQSVHIQTHYQQ